MRTKWQYRTAQTTIDPSGAPVADSTTVPSETEDPDIASVFVVNSNNEYELKPEVDANNPINDQKINKAVNKIKNSKKRKISERSFGQPQKENKWANMFRSLNSFLEEMFRPVDYSPANIR